MSKSFKLIAALFLGLLLTGCSLSPNTPDPSDSLVSASFYPLANLAEQVTGAPVISVIPNGFEPHDFEPTPKDLVKVYNSKLFILNGAGIDPWAEKLVPELESKGIRVINLSEFANLLTYEDHHEDHDDHHEDHDDDHDDHHDDHDDHADDHDDHDHGLYDPHFWLDFDVASSLITQVESALISIDNSNQALYAENANTAQQKLKSLDQSYSSRLANCSLNDVVTSHAAFNYIANRYNFKVRSVSGISAEQEPSPAKLAELADFIKSSNIKHILFETLVSPKVAQTLSAETGATTLVFNPLEGLTKEDISANKDYFSIMQDNLEVLSTALNCQS